MWRAWCAACGWGYTTKDFDKLIKEINKHQGKSDDEEKRHHCIFSWIEPTRRWRKASPEEGQ